jgi:hypothetical protein
MNAFLALSALALAVSVSLIFPDVGPAAMILFAALASVTALVISRHESESRFLMRVFVAAAIVRAALGAFIYYFQLQDFFGGDAFTYDYLGTTLTQFWKGELSYAYYSETLGIYVARNWGMPYTVGAIYMFVGRNMLAVQLFNAVVGAATAPVIFLCARHIFHNLRVAKLATLFVAFFPSLVLWSSQGLKDGPIVFLLAVAMLATLRLGEEVKVVNIVVLALSMFAIFSMRFYVFYMVAASVVGAFVIGMRPITSQSLGRQLFVVLALGLALTYMGVLRPAGAQIEKFGSLQAVQTSRSDLAQQAKSGFGQDVDVSTTTGALTAVPMGLTYLLFAPFPWQLGSLRQSITLPEMVAWWVSFPLLVLGIWFTLKFRLRQAIPILIFTTMLTLAYSVFQGNVGTAYRQRSQILVFYFIFVAVGAVLMLEKRENRKRQRQLEREAAAEAMRAPRPARLPTARPLPPAPPPSDVRPARDVLEV